ncbi:hypothetical protein BDY21DRAFT_420843 [Lineolata rhizophorae]|uniref:Uncharacterized protein n=1 Tax=Lineolata rhizophorae TaxID=578093 RepID=A0A6A6P366_9PEZI|nr:hypothetical protein BDY21DRAFT_420843 [Lineolata rhizophorae]
MAAAAFSPPPSRSHYGRSPGPPRPLPLQTHGKLHKRGHSASSMHSPMSPPISEHRPSFDFGRRTGTPIMSTHEEDEYNEGGSSGARKPHHRRMRRHGSAPEDDPNYLPTSPISPVTSPGMKIKPYLRKLSSKDSGMASNTVDLSLPAAENASLAGLGIQDSGNRSASDVTFAHAPGRRGTSSSSAAAGGGHTRHGRSASNTSQFSTSSLQRPTAPYAHPMRPTPRPYTPPIAPQSSYSNSIGGSEHSGEAGDPLTEDELRLRSQFPVRHSGGSVSSTPPNGRGVPLYIQTGATATGSSSRIFGTASNSFNTTTNRSQTSLSLTLGSPVATVATASGGNTNTNRNRRDTVRSNETGITAATSPSSRTSMDRAFGFLRGTAGRGGDDDAPEDPAERAANIQAARQAYREREAAKERKAEKEALRQLEREHQRHARQLERERRREELREKKRAGQAAGGAAARDRSRSGGSGGGGGATNEKALVEESDAVAGREYSRFAPAHALALPSLSAPPLAADEGVPVGAATRRQRERHGSSGGRWMGFVAWFKTRLLRLSRRLRLS